MPRRPWRPLHHHLSAADERFGLRLGAGVVGMFTASAAFVLLLLLVRSGWPPLRDLDANAAQAAQRIDGSHPGLVRTAETVSNVFDPNVFRVVLGLIALMYLVRGERRHAVWLLVTVFGGAALGVALKMLVGRARPALPDPVSPAPGGMSFPSGHALGATIGCCLLLLLTLRLLPRRGRIAAIVAAVLVVGVVALARVMLGVHFVSDVLAGITLGIAWVAVTTWAYVAWRRETAQPVARAAEVGSAEQPARR